MRVNIRYIASSGREYDLVTNGIRHKTANYHAWEWSPEGTELQYGMRVSDFSKASAKYETELLLMGTPQTRQTLINSLHDDFENDIRHKTPGRLIWGDYYLDCYMIQSSTEPVEDIERWTLNTITIFAAYPFWIREEHVMLPVSTLQETSPYLDYEYDYQFDYTSPLVGATWVKTDFPYESDFELIIYGVAVNPQIVINGYSYLLNMTVPADYYVVIDSRTKTVILHAPDGTKINAFDSRNKIKSVFQKIPGGNLSITWNSAYGADLTIFRERSEPRTEAEG